jgi:uncharacterized protein (TIGR02145 family)
MIYKIAMRIFFISVMLVLLPACTSSKLPQKMSNNVTVEKANTVSITIMQIPADSSGLNDIDGNYYKTIMIGSQIWMAENLRVTRYRDGTPIPYVTDSATWKYLISAAYCWINNDSASYASLYGALYNWYTVNTGRLCPGGWHVPSNSEWSTLTNHLGGASVAGGKLKETDTIHWCKPNTGATNETGFTAIPAGGRGDDGIFGNFGQSNIFWSSNEFDARFAWFRNMSYFYKDVFGYCFNKKNGFSVRCLKDK